MTSNNISAAQQQKVGPAKDGGWSRQAAVWAAILFLAIMLLTVGIYFAIAREMVKSRINELTRERDHLQMRALALEAARSQALRDEQAVLHVFQHCRSAEDVPDLRGQHIVAKRRAMEWVALYVPGGSHSLELSTASRGNSGRVAAAARDAVGGGIGGRKSWRIPLVPRSGYFFRIETDDRGAPVRWKLTGNHPQAGLREGTVLETFVRHSSSWSGRDFVKFPNELDQFARASFDRFAWAVSGVSVLEGTLSGKVGEIPVDIDLQLRIVSDGPATVSASNARDLIVQDRKDVLLTYRGGGKYELRPAPPDSSRSETSE